MVQVKKHAVAKGYMEMSRIIMNDNVIHAVWSLSEMTKL